MTMTATVPAPEHVDVLIVGAGVSGIGCAYHLQTEQPSKSYAIFEAREVTGGTWDLFRYPGIRSDSDLHTFGYEFKPWRNDKSIADGPAILDYIRETARENRIEDKIRTGHRVLGASWDSATARWTVQAEAGGEPVTITCGWLFCASGYYNYEQGFTPAFPGLEDFGGQVIHPQHWPEDLDYAGKRVVVIGSGATAVTIVPAMAPDAAHVTMLQRSPSYIATVPEKDPIAMLLKKRLSPELAYKVTRRKNIFQQRAVYTLSQRCPKVMKKLLRAGVKRQLPEGYPVDVHFNPSYNPWDQRLCAVPNGDLFKAIKKGDASIVTDRIASFTPTGIKLESGAELEADIVVTATGLDLLAFGGIELTVDGEPVNLPDKLVYKAMMLSDVPNYAFAIGYTNSSWTLKVDIVCEFLGRLLGELDRTGTDTCVPHPSDPAMESRPLLDFGAGYVQRAVHKFPRQGTRGPWKLAMSYATDVKNLRKGPVQDPELRFERRAVAAPEADAAAPLAAA
jgi:cation diffusion facilitator CzcD-associated flavoprotein CzcO